MELKYVLFPYLRDIKELTEKQIEVVEGNDIKEKIIVYNEVFNTKQEFCECPDIHKEVEEKLLIVKLNQIEECLKSNTVKDTSSNTKLKK